MALKSNHQRRRDEPIACSTAAPYAHHMASTHGQRVVLLGGGHAHLHVVSQAHRFAAAGLALHLIDDGDFWYSGLATGMVGWQYEPDENRIDLARLAGRHGVTWTRGRVVALDRDARLLRLADGSAVEYDLLSLNVGSAADTTGITGAEHAWPVKPISGLAALRTRIEAWRQAGTSPRLVIVGGGATGCELAANLATLPGEPGEPRCQVTLISGGAGLLAEGGARAARLVLAALRQRGVNTVFDCRITAVRPGAALAADGRSFPADVTVLATGLRPPPFLHDWGLADQPGAGLKVNAHLQAALDLRLFGAGDCIDFADRALPRLGVFAVREASVLADNLIAAATGQPLRRYRPQKYALAILNLGVGEALAMRGRWSWRGRLMMRWKHWLDHRFLSKYRDSRTGRG